MDNAAPLQATTPQGQVLEQQGAPSTEPQVSGNATETQTQQPQVEGQSEEGKQLILGKFKDHKSLEEAYQNLESHTKKVEMDKAELEKLFVSPEATPAPAAAAPEASPQEQSGTSSDELTNLLTPVATKLFSPVLAKLEVRDLLDRFGDRVVSVSKEMKAIKDAKPFLSLEEAFKLAEHDKVEITNRELTQQRNVAAQAQAQKAQVESSQPSGIRTASLEDAIKDGNTSVGDIAEALGPEYAAFAETSRRRKGK